MEARSDITPEMGTPDPEVIMPEAISSDMRSAWK